MGIIGAGAGGGPTVVTDVEEDCVLAQLAIVDQFHQLAAGLIKPLAHRVILRDVHGTTFGRVFFE